MEEERSEIKTGHSASEAVMEKYFKRRDRKNEIRDFDLTFALAYWEMKYITIDETGMQEL